MKNQFDDIIKRLEESDREIALVDMVDKAIVTTTFHFRARKFIQSLINQRQLIVNRKASHKNPCLMLKTIDHLKVNLDAAGSSNKTMARFFLMHEEEIRILIPGNFPSKRFLDFIALRDQAKEINNRQLSML